MRIVFRPLTVLFVLVLATLARSQCALEWTSGGPQRDLTGHGRCTALWDPDGAGPLPQRLVFGGDSLDVGLVRNQRVVTWDGAQWEALGPGPGTTGSVRTLVVWNGSLIAGGDFTGAGLTNIARWDGAAWQPLGTGFPNPVDALTVWNGNLAAAGHFGVGVTLTGVLRTWNGTTWTTIFGLQTLQVPMSLVSYQGFLCVGGYTANDTGVLERWNGTTWSPAITANDRITSLVVKPTAILGGNDTLFVGGRFTSIGGSPRVRIAATTGGSTFAWTALGSGLPAACKALHVRTYGVAQVSYVVSAATDDPLHAVTQWTVPLGGPPSSWLTIDTQVVDSLAYYANAYHAASSTSGLGAGLRHNGLQWRAIAGPGVDEEVHAVTPFDDDVVVGGRFSSIAGVAASGIARWDGSTFQPLGSGLTGTSFGGPSADALLTLKNGDVVAGGLFVFAGTMNGNCIARWNGAMWSTFGTGMNQQVLALAELQNGDLVAGGWFTQADGLPCTRIARWDGSQWRPFGSGANSGVFALAVRQDGVLFAAGGFSTMDGVACNRIAQWNGTSWSPVGAGCNGAVFDLAVRPNGDVVAVGMFSTAGGVAADRCARWNGSAWLPMGTATADPSSPRAVLALANGDVVVSHGFHAPTAVPDDGLSRWNGSTWSPLGTISDDATDDNAVWSLAQKTNGEIVVGGDFRLVNGAIARNLAAVHSTCAPTAASYGAGCNSTAGPLVLTADTLPWIGASFRTTTHGVAANSLCLGLVGFSQVAIPLSALLPEGQPGCSLLTSADLTLFAPNGPGNTATSSFALGNDTSLIGLTFFAQTIPLEFDALGAISAIRASNALSLGIGTL